MLGIWGLLNRTNLVVTIAVAVIGVYITTTNSYKTEIDRRLVEEAIETVRKVDFETKAREFRRVRTQVYDCDYSNPTQDIVKCNFFAVMVKTTLVDAIISAGLIDGDTEMKTLCYELDNPVTQRALSVQPNILPFPTGSAMVEEHLPPGSTWLNRPNAEEFLNRLREFCNQATAG